MRPCPNCECFVSVVAKRCPRCEAALEPVVASEPTAPEPRELALVGAPSEGASATTTDPIVRGVMASVALPKLPQPFATDPAELAVFLGVPVGAPEPPAPKPPSLPPETPAPRTADELAADLSPATIAAIMDAAAEITAGGVSATWSPQADAPPDAALERVIARANELAEHAAAPAATEPEARAVEEEQEDEDEPQEPPPPAPARAPAPTPSEPTIVATPLAAPVVIAVPDVAARPPRRKWFARRDAFTPRFSRRERVLAKTCVALVGTLVLSVLALKLPVGPRPELGATTSDIGPSIGTPETPVTSPFADAIRIQTRADLRVAVATAANIFSAWKSFRPASPALLARELPQFAFVRGAQSSVRVGQLSVAASNAQIVFAEYAGPKGCAYARLLAHRDAQVVIGATGTSCRATAPPARGWSALGAG